MSSKIQAKATGKQTFHLLSDLIAPDLGRYQEGHTVNSHCAEAHHNRNYGSAMMGPGSKEQEDFDKARSLEL